MHIAHPSSGVSITSTETFAARAQRSEARRVGLWALVLIGVLTTFILRRCLGGIVMAKDSLFWPIEILLTAAIGLQLILLRILTRANRQGRLLPRFVWQGSAAIDICIPIAILTLLVWNSPRGAATALSGPSLLLLPIVILLSVLRLKPRFVLIIGLVAGLAHAGLAVHAIRVTNAPLAFYPVYFTYSASLIIMGAAGAFICSEIRGHVVGALDEAVAHERAEQSIAAIQRDLGFARDIQAGLLPVGSPEFSGFDIAGMSRPADLTGGDYYDWQLLPDGRMIIVIADVTGHGIGAAMVMAVCRAYARASAALTADPSELMRRLNELVHADLPASRFITFAIAVLCPSGAVQLLSAGHGPSFLYSAAKGEIIQFGGDGLPLGISATERYEPAIAFHMDQEDMLVLLTDGFHEFHKADECFGIERVEEALIAHKQESSEVILRRLDETVRSFAAGSPQMDDMTAVVIKRVRSRQAASQPVPNNRP